MAKGQLSDTSHFLFFFFVLFSNALTMTLMIYLPTWVYVSQRERATCVETDNEMWQFWLKSASSRTVMNFQIRNTWFEFLLCHFVFGAWRTWAMRLASPSKSPAVQSRGDNAGPQQPVVRTQGSHVCEAFLVVGVHVVGVPEIFFTFSF